MWIYEKALRFLLYSTLKIREQKLRECRPCAAYEDKEATILEKGYFMSLLNLRMFEGKTHRFDLLIANFIVVLW